jgi:hypothetical protein
VFIVKIGVKQGHGSFMEFVTRFSIASKTPEGRIGEECGDIGADTAGFFFIGAKGMPKALCLALCLWVDEFKNPRGCFVRDDGRGKFHMSFTF